MVVTTVKYLYKYPLQKTGRYYQKNKKHALCSFHIGLQIACSPKAIKLQQIRNKNYKFVENFNHTIKTKSVTCSAK